MKAIQDNYENVDHEDAKGITWSVIFGIFFFVISVLLFFQVRDRQTWIEVKGLLVSCEEKDGWRISHGVVRKKETVATLTYTYAVDGQKYTGKLVKHFAPVKEWKDKEVRQKLMADKDYQIPVYYNPKHYYESVLEKPSTKIMDYWYVGLMFAISIYGIWSGYKRIKARYDK